MIYQIIIFLSGLSIIVALTLPVTTKSSKPLQAQKYQSNLLKTQSEALSSRQSKEIEGVSYNEWGNVRKAQSINFKHQKLVIFLGCGKSEIRQREFDD